MASIIDTLTEVPLFCGVTRERMSQVVGTTKFNFVKFAQGDTILSPGARCDHLLVIISGSVSITVTTTDGRFHITQTISAPGVISPEFLFGSSTVFPGNVTAIDTVSLIEISKSDYIKIINSDPIFAFNYLNYLAMNAQKSVEGILSVAGGGIEERIAYWIIATTQPGATDIKLTCRQRDICSVFAVQRSSFTAALDNLRERGCVDYTPGEIRVIDRRKLLNILRNGLE